MEWCSAARPFVGIRWCKEQQHHGGQKCVYHEWVGVPPQLGSVLEMGDRQVMAFNTMTGWFGLPHDLWNPQISGDIAPHVFSSSQLEDDLPIEIWARLQRPNHQGALLGDGLAACMISLAEEKLKVGSVFWVATACQKVTADSGYICTIYSFFQLTLQLCIGYPLVTLPKWLVFFLIQKRKCFQFHILSRIVIPIESYITDWFFSYQPYRSHVHPYIFCDAHFESCLHRPWIRWSTRNSIKTQNWWRNWIPGISPSNPYVLPWVGAFHCPPPVVTSCWAS